MTWESSLDPWKHLVMAAQTKTGVHIFQRGHYLYAVSPCCGDKILIKRLWDVKTGDWTNSWACADDGCNKRFDNIDVLVQSSSYKISETLSPLQIHTEMSLWFSDMTNLPFSDFLITYKR